MRLTVSQVQMMKRLAHPVPLVEWRKWDQRALRGLFIRGLLQLSRKNEMSVSEMGWAVCSDMAKLRLRTEHLWEKDVFSNAREIMVRRRKYA